MLKNDKYEKFAKGKADGMNNADAARYAGYSSKTAKQNGLRIYKIDYVKERIKELREEKLDNLGIDKYYIIKNIIDTIMDPDCNKQTKVHALFELGDRTGLLSKEKEEKGKSEKEKTEEEIDKELKEINDILGDTDG